MSIIEKALEKMGKRNRTAADRPVREDPDVPMTTEDAAASSPASTKPDRPVARKTPTEPAPLSGDLYADALAPLVNQEIDSRRVLKIRGLGIEGVLSPDSERSRTAEEYRMIKRPLLMRAFGARPLGEAHRNLIMLTSAAEGEGKTFSSLNLAISIAMELDRTVLLVDSDLAKPGLSRLLKINNLPGLTDRLIDESLNLRDLLLHTDIPKLTVLPAGRRHRRSTELLASNSMRRLLDELALRYSDRVVLFDSPPVLATSEASVLAQQMGQICLVVESAVTPQFLIKDALTQLDSPDNVSMILNKCKPDLFLGKYGYGYGYGYRYGYGYGYGYGYSQDEK